MHIYNIHVHVEDTATFSLKTPGLPDSPITVDPELLTVEKADEMTIDTNAELIHLLDIAMVPPSAYNYTFTAPDSSEESPVIDFMVELFKVIGYVKRNTIARTRRDTFIRVWGAEICESGCLFSRSRSVSVAR